MTDQQASQVSEEEIVIQIDWTSEPPPVYANGAQVVHTQREFSLTFTDFAGLIGRGSPPGETEPRARVVSSVRLTPDVFFQLAAAAASNWNKYINRFGDPRNPAPKFQLHGGGNFQLEGVEPVATSHRSPNQ